MKYPIPVYRRIPGDLHEGMLSPDKFVRQHHAVFRKDDGHHGDALWEIFNEAVGAAEF